MKRRILWIALAILILVPVVGYVAVRANMDLLTGAIGRAVESATGKALILDEPPSLAFFPQVGVDLGKATWGDPATGDMAVQLQSAKVRVALLPLLSKKIEINDVELNSPVITVRQQAAQASTQASESAPAQSSETPANTPAQTGGTPASQADAGSGDAKKQAELSLDAVRVTGGTLIVEAPDLNLRVTALDVDLKDVAIGRKGSVQTKAHVLLEQKGAKPVETDIALSTGFDLSLPVVTLSGLSLKTGPVPGMLDVPAELSGDLSVNTETLELNKLDVAAALAGAVLKAKGAVDAGTMAGTVNVSLESADLTATLSGLNVAPKDTVSGLGALSLNGDVVLSGTTLKLDNLKTKLDAPKSGKPGMVPTPLELSGGFTLDTKTLKSDKLDLKGVVAGSAFALKGSADLEKMAANVAFTVSSADLTATLATMNAAPADAVKGLGALNASGTVALSGNTLTVNNLKSKLDAPKNGATGMAPVPMELNGSLKLNTKTLKSEALDLGGSAAGSTFSLKGSADLGTISGNVAFSVNTQNLRQLLTRFGVRYVPKDAKAMGPLALKGNAAFTEKSVKLTNLDGKLDDTTVKGSLSAALPGTVSADLKLGALNADRYMPADSGPAKAQTTPKPAPQDLQNAKSAPTSAGSKQAPEPAKTAAYPDADIALSVQSLVVNGIRIDALNAKVKGKNGAYMLNPCTFKVFDAAVTASGAANLNTEQFSLKTTANGINAQSMLRQLAKEERVIGKLNLAADLSVKGATEAAIRKSLAGSMALSGNANVDTAMLPSGWAQLAKYTRTLEISRIDVKAQAKNGAVTLKPLTTKGKRFETSGEGTVNLPTDAVNIKLVATIGDLVMPMYMRGSLADPKYSVDAVSAVKSVLKKNPELSKKVEKEVNRGAKQLEKGLKKLFK